MDSTLESSSVSDAYHHKYAGKTLLLKLSGKSLLHPDISLFAEDIRSLVRLRIRFIIVCGSGEQNTQFLKQHLAQTGQEWQEPQRVNGRRVTDERQLLYGVLPAFEALRDQIEELLPEAYLLEPWQLNCTRIPELGYVGDPVSAEGLNSRKIVVVPSVWSEGIERFNVNADDAMRVIGQQERNRIAEAMVVTETGGVLSEGRVVPLIWAEDIAEDGRHARIDVTGGGGGMQKKLKEAKQMLTWLPKIIITSLTGVRQEIERIQGNGTLVASRSAVRVEPLEVGSDDEAIFDALVGRNVLSGAFVQRSTEDLQKLKKHVHCLKAGNSILGAFALIPKGEWMELAAVCSEYNGSGVGDVLVQSAEREAINSGVGRIYSVASSPGMAGLLWSNGFTNRGAIADLQKSAPAAYCHFPWIPAYDVANRGRTTFLCTWQKSADDS